MFREAGHHDLHKLGGIWQGHVEAERDSISGRPVRDSAFANLRGRQHQPAFHSAVLNYQDGGSGAREIRLMPVPVQLKHGSVPLNAEV